MTVTETSVDLVADQVKSALKRAFPEDTVDVRKTVRGRVHVLVVSPQFNNMTEREKQDWVYDVLSQSVGKASELVSAVVPYSTDELYSG